MKSWNHSLNWGLGMSLVLTGLVPSLSHATLPASAFSRFQIPIYGIYATSDPSCTTGFVRIGFSSTPITADFLAGNSAGSYSAASAINCVLMVAKNSAEAVIAPGAYTTTSTVGSSTVPDSVCNAGKTFSGILTNFPTAPIWPANTELPMTDLAGASLSPTTTSLASANGNEIIPFYISTNSGCFGDPDRDPVALGCWRSGDSSANFVRPIVPPASAGDLVNGMKLDGAAAAGQNYRFFTRLSGTIGGVVQGGQNVCGGVKTWTWGFEAI